MLDLNELLSNVKKIISFSFKYCISVSSRGISFELYIVWTWLNFKWEKIEFNSFEDNESENEAENTGLFISPDNKFILFFDILIIISTLIVAIYNPYYISTMKFFCFSNHFLIKYIYFFIDFLFICD